MTTLAEDIKIQSGWIVKAFAADGYLLDYSVHSFMQIDTFFLHHTKDGRPVKGGRLAKNTGVIIFSIGSYIGETVVRNIPGAHWQLDDDSPEAELTAAVVLPNGSTFWPMQRVIKRMQNGAEDSVYVYGHQLTNEYTHETFDQAFWQLSAHANTKKPWWKIW